MLGLGLGWVTYLVVVKTAAILCGPRSIISLSILATSVRNSSPSKIFSMHTGISPAVAIHFKQDFWSIRGHITYAGEALGDAPACCGAIESVDGGGSEVDRGCCVVGGSGSCEVAVV